MHKRALQITLLLIVVILLLGWFGCPGHEGEHNVSASEAIIDLPLEQSWQKLQDLTLAHHYVPMLEKTEITTEQKTGVGTSRRVYQSQKKYLNETVSEWNEGSGFTMKLHTDGGDAPFPFAELQFTYRIGDAGNGKTQLNTLLEYEMGSGCFGHWMNEWVIKRALEKNAGTVAENLKQFYETGVSLQDQPAPEQG